MEGNLRIPFQILRSSRKTMAIQVKNDGMVMVRIPYRTAWKDGEAFLEKEKEWVTEHYRRAVSDYRPPMTYTDDQVEEGRKRARLIFQQRAAYYGEIMGVSYGRISIRQQKTRWGSCSTRGNLNFNWKLVLMPQEILDYVVVHELAHRKEMNHSPQFWAVVEAVLPNYREYRRWLREHGGEY